MRWSDLGCDTGYHVFALIGANFQSRSSAHRLWLLFDATRAADHAPTSARAIARMYVYSLDRIVLQREFMSAVGWSAGGALHIAVISIKVVADVSRACQALQHSNVASWAVLLAMGRAPCRLWPSRELQCVS